MRLLYKTKMITQTDLSEKLGIKKSQLSKILSGKQRLSRKMAIEVEKLTGINRIVFMDGSQADIIEAIEEIYGKINFNVGRIKHEN